MDEFIEQEIWHLTVMAGFQRSKIYEGLKVSEMDRKAYRDCLHNWIKQKIDTNYTNEVDEDAHYSIIAELANYASNYNVNGQFIPLKYGVAQKLLNLYLKYQWCLGKIQKPPHFPVDRIIQQELNKQAKRLGVPQRKVVPWTKITSKVKYKEVIDFAIELNKKLKFESLPELELHLFSRR